MTEGTRTEKVYFVYAPLLATAEMVQQHGTAGYRLLGPHPTKPNIIIESWMSFERVGRIVAEMVNKQPYRYPRRRFVHGRQNLIWDRRAVRGNWVVKQTGEVVTIILTGQAVQCLVAGRDANLPATAPLVHADLDAEPEEGVEEGVTTAAWGVPTPDGLPDPA